jgi:hypothetical protein
MLTIAVGVLLFCLGVIVFKLEITTDYTLSRVVDGGTEVISLLPFSILLVGFGFIVFIAGVRLDRYDK